MEYLTHKVCIIMGKDLKHPSISGTAYAVKHGFFISTPSIG
jgi:hypothetical protein